MTERTNVSFDAVTRSAIDKLPRAVKISHLLKWVVMAAALSDAQFAKALEYNAGLKATHDIIAPRVQKILGVK